MSDIKTVLTTEQINSCLADDAQDDVEFHEFARAIEARVLSAIDSERKELLEALQLAQSILDYVPGDAWEREATANDRETVRAILNKFTPVIEPAAPQTTWTCDGCQRSFTSLSAVRTHKRYSQKCKAIAASKSSEGAKP